MLAVLFEVSAEGCLVGMLESACAAGLPQPPPSLGPAELTPAVPRDGRPHPPPTGLGLRTEADRPHEG